MTEPAKSKDPQVPAKLTKQEEKEQKELEFIPFGATAAIRLSIAIVRSLLTEPTKKGHPCSDRDAFRFIRMCSSKGLDPFEGDAFLVGYDTQDGPKFSQITAHQAFLKRAELHPEYDGMQSGVIVQNEDKSISELEGDFYMDDQKLLGAWAKVHFKNRKYPILRRVKLETFRKTSPLWLNNPAGMIVKCFDEETEVLTTLGFEKFATAEGQVLQVTDNGLAPTNAVPFFQSYSGPMIEHISRNGNFLVTPNHDLPLAINGEIEMAVEARHLLSIKQRDDVLLPLTAVFERPDYPIEDKWLILIAAYVADGSDNSRSSGFSITVSRPHKVALLRSLGLHISEAEKLEAGDIAVTSSGRSIITRMNKRAFYYSRNHEINWLVGRKKTINCESLLALSQRQAKLFIDTWMAFDGHHPRSCLVGRIYMNRLEHCAAFEIGANLAGYSVSSRKWRQSDIGRPNCMMTVTNRSHINICKYYVKEVQNPGRGVWCVKVPSSKIVVRRHGFSFVCHQCSEADALRSSFPTKLGGLYLNEELDFTNAVSSIPAGPSFMGPAPESLQLPPPTVPGKNETVSASDDEVPMDFQSPVAPAAAPNSSSSSSASPAAEQTKAAATHAKAHTITQITELMKTDVIPMENLIKFLIAKGLAPEDATSMDGVAHSKLLQLFGTWNNVKEQLKTGGALV